MLHLLYASRTSPFTAAVGANQVFHYPRQKWPEIVIIKLAYNSMCGSDNTIPHYHYRIQKEPQNGVPNPTQFYWLASERRTLFRKVPVYTIK